MLILRDPSQLDQVEDAYIRGLIAQRFQEITIEGYSYDDLGMFVLAQPGDSIADLEKAGGVWITTGIFSDAKFGDPDFAPCFEVLEEHTSHCFEMVHILAGDYGVCTVIPDQQGIDPELLRFCREYAEPVPVIG
ncbi:hypothetical protein [Zoogloea sp.]|uniref:hypothetical protein n=1 Tax=Zoogloea sp. TaxID=49181 RepID=UPI0035B4B13D